MHGHYGGVCYLVAKGDHSGENIEGDFRRTVGDFEGPRRRMENRGAWIGIALFYRVYLGDCFLCGFPEDRVYDPAGDCYGCFVWGDGLFGDVLGGEAAVAGAAVDIFVVGDNCGGTDAYRLRGAADFVSGEKGCGVVEKTKEKIKRLHRRGTKDAEDARTTPGTHDMAA